MLNDIYQIPKLNIFVVTTFNKKKIFRFVFHLLKYLYYLKCDIFFKIAKYIFVILLEIVETRKWRLTHF